MSLRASSAVRGTVGPAEVSDFPPPQWNEEWLENLYEAGWDRVPDCDCRVWRALWHLAVSIYEDAAKLAREATLVAMGIPPEPQIPGLPDRETAMARMDGLVDVRDRAEFLARDAKAALCECLYGGRPSLFMAIQNQGFLPWNDEDWGPRPCPQDRQPGDPSPEECARDSFVPPYDPGDRA